MADRKVITGWCKWCDEIVVEVRDEFGQIVQKHRCPVIDKIIRYWW